MNPHLSLTPRHAARFAAACLTLAVTLTAHASAPTDAEITALHTEIGSTMDRRYYQAGRRVDLARFDFEEMQRQDRPAPRDLLRRVDRADRDMRARWLALEKRRAALHDRLRALPPRAAHTLRIEDLEPESGDAKWFGLRSARLEWGSGRTVPLPLASFKGPALVPGYAYLVEKSDAAFIYGQGSGQSTMAAGFELPDGASGDARLVVSGLDDDKPGVTRIRIAIDGTTVFEGANPFQATPWTEHSFPIPASAFRDTAPKDDAGTRLHTDLLALRRDVNAFGAWADGLASEIDAATGRAREGLVYEPLKVAPDFWRTGFMRGVSYVPFEQEMEHHFKSFRHLDANMLYSYTGHYNKPTELPATLELVKELGFPYVQFTYPMRNEERDRLYLGDPDAMLASARAFVKEASGDSGVPVHLAVDEPNFRDEYATDPAVLKAFRAYMEQRRPIMAKAGITVPENPTPVLKIDSPADRPLWMEWQVFKTRHMAGNFRELWNGLQEDGLFPFVIIQDQRSTEPQRASHVMMGHALPMLSTDLYSNGNVREAMVLDMLRNTMDGPAILTAGAGYSDHTPGRFRRSMAVAMAHGDGVLQWTDIYFSKYRDPRAFWKTAVDDQGRNILSNWRPEYWSIMEEEYARMAQADRYLSGAESQARVAVLFSERTAISDSATSGDSYFNRVQGLYSDLLRRGRPLDIQYVETLTPKELARYRGLILPDTRLVLPGLEGWLRSWVSTGGTLIATADASLADQWGVPRQDFGLANVFGAHYAGEATGASAYTVDGKRVPYDVKSPYTKVTVAQGARVLATWDTGDPALIRNDYRRGRSYLFTSRRVGARVTGSTAASGLYGAGDRTERALLARLVDEAAGEQEVWVENAPDGLEVQVQRKGNATVVHLVDWMEGRTVKGLKLRIGRPAPWTAFYPTGKRQEQTSEASRTLTVRPFRIHEMVVVQATD